MSFDIKLLKEKDTKNWDNFVKSNNDTTFYHQIGWKNVIERTYGHKPYYLFAKNDTDEIIGILPMFLIKSLFFGKRLISIPFTSYGGLCCGNDYIGKAMLDEIKYIGDNLGVDFFEFRCLKSNNAYQNLRYMNDYSTFFLDLSSGIGYIWKNMNKKVRNMIRKGEKNNLKFESEINSEINNDAISRFYEIYSKNMKYLGTPVHSQKFFENIYKTFSQDVVIATAKKNEDVISSIYLLKFKDTIISGWASSLIESLKYAPNDFIYWNSIKYSCENNILKFDFGRSLANSNNSNFKKRWGCVEVQLYYYYPLTKILLAPQNEYGNCAKIWSKLPYNITKVIGPIIRRGIP